MAIEIRETFRVEAPLDAVWRLMMDPHQIVTCLPGAQLDEAVDAQTFLGSVKVRVGAVTTTYKGRVRFAELDEQAHAVRIVAEGRETGGGMAKGAMSGRLRALAPGETEVVAEATIDLTGRIMQVGRGMIQGVSQQLFQQFVRAIQERLKVAAGAEAPAPAAAPQPIRIGPLVLRAVWAAMLRLLRRLLRRPPQLR